MSPNFWIFTQKFSVRFLVEVTIGTQSSVSVDAGSESIFREQLDRVMSDSRAWAAAGNSREHKVFEEQEQPLNIYLEWVPLLYEMTCLFAPVAACGLIQQRLPMNVIVTSSRPLTALLLDGCSLQFRFSGADWMAYTGIGASNYSLVIELVSPVQEQPAERVTLSHYICTKSTGEKERFSGRFHPFLTRSSPGILTRLAGDFANIRVNILS
ncbi:hypothetical protein C8J57DRAFT_1466538 [Mycena rebaudengoi]|nr:hypothetical protein C8J57DRAFT_1466538 [Mycena rebaudengoi]